jgi:hypothetical protein
VNERIYDRSANRRKSPLNSPARSGYQGPLPPALEPLRPFLIEHDDTIRSILAAQATIKSTIKTLEHQHEQLSDQLCAYAEAKLKMR